MTFVFFYRVKSKIEEEEVKGIEEKNTTKNNRYMKEREKRMLIFDFVGAFTSESCLAYLIFYFYGCKSSIHH